MAQENEYGVYFEYVVPQTSFVVVSGLSVVDATLSATRNLGHNHGFKILGVYPIETKLTYPTKKQEQPKLKV